MHEMGVAAEIIDIAISSIPDNIKNPTVEIINLKIGKLSAIVVESLCFCFDVMAKDTILSGAKLNIKEIPVSARCRDCNFEWTANEPVFVCRKCNSGSIDIISGRELDIESIEVIEE